ncbi:aminoacyl-histidine dipeptidase, M20 family [Formosa sp. Hel3_A1_48]|jgi:dipeptidase D|uniref:aminoacyl-histidine dipeptidase n=1 Tax=Formosa sp. Hel3_A1_48 TaxID=1336795 RepID=UPI00084E0B39|nr:aminoacyl-histidine dipeptidase [Formosa sp. Hel3_A1_48]AOR25317.1 aminoacyl-histidine dipeptidase, M20 family [Formosa sp. Hel3_A1_48]
MNTTIRQLSPVAIWSNFADLNTVPRPSKKEERVITFIKDFGVGLNLETIEDEVGNVIIKKPATPGMEDRKAVVLQSHLDMVHQKNMDTDFDFLTQGIQMYVDGDWVKANGTTLGADNGLGVATIMAVLQSTDIPHPALEALFTVDEETGMTGAMGLQPGLLKGEILLNLDTEEDDEIGVGCAGGIDITATGSYSEEPRPQSTVAYDLSVKGLQGGHSGMDIHKGFGNANKLISRLLYDGFDRYGLRISKIDGGSLRNAIPRESRAVVVVDAVHKDAFESDTEHLISAIEKEFDTIEPELKIVLNPTNLPEAVMELGVQQPLLKALRAAHNGVYRMSPDIEDLVETSNNVARVLIENGQIHIGCLTRSSVDSSKMDLAQTLKATFELAGCAVEFSGDYPGWTPNMKASILKVLKDLYVQLNGSEPHVAACHAGLECGILGTHYPSMEMISFGPNIKGAHSPDERAQISSVQKFWVFLKAILAAIPEKL